MSDLPRKYIVLMMIGAATLLVGWASWQSQPSASTKLPWRPEYMSWPNEVNSYPNIYSPRSSPGQTLMQDIAYEFFMNLSRQRHIETRNTAKAQGEERIQALLQAGARWDELSMAACGRHDLLNEYSQSNTKDLITYRFSSPSIKGVMPSFDMTLLMVASAAAQFETVKWCVEHGADVNAVGVYHYQRLRPLHFAYGLHNGSLDPLHAEKAISPPDDAPNILRYLLQHGADPTLRHRDDHPNPWELDPKIAELMGLPPPKAEGGMK